MGRLWRVLNVTGWRPLAFALALAPALAFAPDFGRAFAPALGRALAADDLGGVLGRGAALGGALARGAALGGALAALKLRSDTEGSESGLGRSGRAKLR